MPIVSWRSCLQADDRLQDADLLERDGEHPTGQDGIGFSETGFACEGGEEICRANVRAGGPGGECGEDEDAGGDEEAGALDGRGNAVVHGDSGVLVTHDKPAIEVDLRRGRLVAVDKKMGAEG
jgi:hypothetical protein